MFCFFFSIFFWGGGGGGGGGCTPPPPPEYTCVTRKMAISLPRQKVTMYHYVSTRFASVQFRRLNNAEMCLATSDKCESSKE